MVKTTEELIEIRDELYQKIYENTQPEADFKEMEERENPYDIPRYKLYYIENGKLLEIISDFLGNKDLTNYNLKKIRRSVLLGAAPMTDKEKVNQYREEVGLSKID